MKMVVLLLTPEGLWDPRGDQTTLLFYTSLFYFHHEVQLLQATVLREQELYLCDALVKCQGNRHGFQFQAGRAGGDGLSQPR